MNHFVPFASSRHFQIGNTPGKIFQADQYGNWLGFLEGRQIADRLSMNRFLLTDTARAVLERFVDAEEAAQFVGMHPKTLERLARKGTVPGHPIGEGYRRKRWRFLMSELDLWLRARIGHKIR